MSLLRRIRIAADKLDAVANPIGLAETGGKSLKRAEKILVRIEDDIGALAAAVSQVLHASQVVNLTMPERNCSAVAAFKAWAKDCGAAIVPFDSAHRQVTVHAAEEHRAYWNNQNVELMAGLVRFEIAEALEREGILTWCSEPDDGHIRVVDTQWLTAHADIFAHVFGAWPGGRRCRFCRIEEIPASQQLQAIDPEQRRGGAFDNGIPRLPRGAVLTHERCRPHWLQWLSIASRYPTVEAARAADGAAGRSSSQAPPLPMLAAPEVTAEPYHINRSEQGFGSAPQVATS